MGPHVIQKSNRDALRLLIRKGVVLAILDNDKGALEHFNWIDRSDRYIRLSALSGNSAWNIYDAEDEDYIGAVFHAPGQPFELHFPNHKEQLKGNVFPSNSVIFEKWPADLTRIFEFLSSETKPETSRKRTSATTTSSSQNKRWKGSEVIDLRSPSPEPRIKLETTALNGARDGSKTEDGTSEPEAAKNSGKLPEPHLLSRTPIFTSSPPVSEPVFKVPNILDTEVSGNPTRSQASPSQEGSDLIKNLQAEWKQSPIDELEFILQGKNARMATFNRLAKFAIQALLNREQTEFSGAEVRAMMRAIDPEAEIPDKRHKGIERLIEGVRPKKPRKRKSALVAV